MTEVRIAEIAIYLAEDLNGQIVGKIREATGISAVIQPGTDMRKILARMRGSRDEVFGFCEQIQADVDPVLLAQARFE